MISVKTKQTQEINRLQSLKDSLKSSLRPNSEKNAELLQYVSNMSLEAVKSGSKKKKQEESESSSSSSSSSSSDSDSDSDSSSSEAEVVGDMTIEEEEERANELLLKENEKLMKKGGSISVEFSESDEDSDDSNSDSDSDSSSDSSSPGDENGSLVKNMSDSSEGEADEEGRGKKKKKSKKKKYESEEEEDLSDFIVDDNEVELMDDYDNDQDGALRGKLSNFKIKIHQPSDESAVDDPRDTPSGSEQEPESDSEEQRETPRKKKNKKRSKAEYFLDNESEKKRKRGDENNEEDEYENLEENEERFYQQEYPMDRNVKIPDDLHTHYKNYFIFEVTSALKPDWKTKLKKMLTDMRGKLQNHNTKDAPLPPREVDSLKRNITAISSQLSSRKVIKKHLLKCIFSIMCWIRGGINSGKAAHRKTMAKLDSILLEGESSNIKRARFEKLHNVQGICHISGVPIRKGQGWLVTITKMNDTEVTYMMDAKWQHFLSYWLNLYSHSDIIKDSAKRYFNKDKKEGVEETTERFEDFKKDENVNKFARTLMASLAWVYKMLRDSQFDEPFRKYFPEKWYSVCKLNDTPNKRAKK